MICNNRAECHNSEVIHEDYSAIYVCCSQCGHSKRIGLDAKGNPEHRLYGEWFKRDVLQEGNPLYYKYDGARDMNVV